jgi:hypothetical protein
MHSQVISQTQSEAGRTQQSECRTSLNACSQRLVALSRRYRPAYPFIRAIGRPSAGSRVAFWPTASATKSHCFAAFKAEAPPLTYSPQNDLEWLTLAQHHGVPTRLLDWTKRFQVALYFGVQQGGFFESFDPSTGERGMRKVDALLTADEAAHPFSTGLSGLGHRADRSSREPTQGVCVVILDASCELRAAFPYSRPSRFHCRNAAPTCARGLELRRPRLPCVLRSAEYRSRSVHIEGPGSRVGAE